jgi:hypothetical protein
MSNKSKRKKHKAAAHPNQDSGDSHMNQDIHVRGPIEIHRSPSLTEEHRAERNESNAQEKKRNVIQIITLISLFIVAGLSFWQDVLTRRIANLTQRTYETSQRPYIGDEGINCQLLTTGKNGEPEVAKSADRTDGMNISASIKNFGPVPGSNFIASWRLFLNDVEQKTKRIPDTPRTLYPSQWVELRGGYQGDDYQRLKNGTTTLEIEVTVGYDGPTGHYSECMRHRYMRENGQFFNLGNCTHQ